MTTTPKDCTTDKRVFEIYSGKIKSDALDKNVEIRAENESLQTTRALLLEIIVEKSGEVLWTGSILDCVEESGEQDEVEHLSVPVDDCEAVPLREIIQLSCSIGGFPALKHPFDYVRWGSSHFASVKDDDTVEMKLKFGDACLLVGYMENFPCEVGYIRKMIGRNRLIGHLESLFMVDAVTGERLMRNFDANIDGATFRLSKIEVPKKSVQPILDQECIAAEKVANDEQVSELHKLSEIYDVDRSIRAAMEERASLLRDNILFKLSRDTVETVQVIHPGGVYNCNLGNGCRGTFVNSFLRVDKPSWRVNIPAGSGKISLLEVHRMRVLLSGFPLAVSGDFVRGVQFTEDLTIMCLPYNKFLNAFFLFDESWNDIDLQEVIGGNNFVDWIRVQLDGVSPIRTYDGPKLFVRLICLDFHLGVAQHCLDVLGVAYAPTEDDKDEEGS